MEHIFLLNPYAGSGQHLQILRDQINALTCAHTLYETTGHRDATHFVRSYCDAHPGKEMRFYACGGDGTIKEVAEALIGRENVSLCCIPIGSGNDFVKYFGGADNFKDISRLLTAKAQPIDMILARIGGFGDTYAVNVLNFGFDAHVANVMNRVRHIPLIGGKFAYTTGIVVSLLTAMKSRAYIYADGELLNPKGEFLLCTVANCSHVGGAFRCAPRADAADGLLEVCAVKPISVFRFLRLMKPYAMGTHLEDKRFEPYVIYRRARDVEVTFRKIEPICLDGEMYASDDLEVSVIEKVLHFASPEEQNEPAPQPAGS